MEKAIKKETTILSWAAIAFMVLVILFQGFFTFFVVGDLGQPDWDYRPIKDVPGESPYAMYPLQPDPQHIKGKKGE